MWQEGFMIHLTLQSLNPSPKAVWVLDKPNSEQDREIAGDAQWRNIFISSGGTQCWCPCIVFHLHPEHVSFWRYLHKEQKEEMGVITRQKQNCRSEVQGRTQFKEQRLGCHLGEQRSPVTVLCVQWFLLPQSIQDEIQVSAHRPQAATAASQLPLPKATDGANATAHIPKRVDLRTWNSKHSMRM